MLGSKNSSAIIAVSDIDRARLFYRDTLGLALIEEGMGGVMVFKTGATQLVVYPSDAAGTNKANAAVWDVGDEIEAIVADLRSKGVQFEHYPQMGMPIENDIHVGKDMKLVWFKDPDGNILHINKM